MSIAIVGPALIFHELAHKFVAQKYDLLAVYVMWPTGIAIALLISLITQGGFIFAALGAVVISSVYHTRLGYRFIGLTSDQMGKISWAGPMTNIALAIISYILMPLSPGFFSLSAYINLIIAIFNCLPVPPLDGTKILRWNIPVWLGTLVNAGVLMFLPGIIGVGLSIIIAVLLMVVIVVFVQVLFPHGQQMQTEFR
jgi:Zn-dependent protease